MIVNTRIREMITDPQRTSQITEAIAESVESFGMQSFDQSLMKLVRQKLITFDEAKAAASNTDDFVLRFKGIMSMGGENWKGFDSPEASTVMPVTSIEVEPVPVKTMEKIPIEGGFPDVDDDDDDDDDD